MGKPGPKPGYRQSAEHVAKRMRYGPEHHAWKGDAIITKSGRSRALRAYPQLAPCVVCGAARTERHHRNGDTTDNTPENIVAVCRRCHMAEDGRLDAFRELAKRNQPKAAAARWGKSVLPG